MLPGWSSRGRSRSQPIFDSADNSRRVRGCGSILFSILLRHYRTRGFNRSKTLLISVVGVLGDLPSFWVEIPKVPAVQRLLPVEECLDLLPQGVSELQPAETPILLVLTWPLSSAVAAGP